MNCSKIADIIKTFRKEKNMTQKQLAEKLMVSDKAVSKWERGYGLPDISLLTDLSHILGIDINVLLKGNIDENEQSGGNMKKTRFYMCKTCGNIITTEKEANISCCGKIVNYIEPKKAEENEKLSIEKIENDYYITSTHPMEKGHYISFVAFLNGDTMIMKKLYPQWDMQVRIQNIGHGILVWGCTEHGLFYQIV